MRRVHLFEWEDQPWLPAIFRDFITDQLKYTHNQAMRQPVNQAIARRLADLLKRSRTTRIVDLCSGAGGPIARIGRLIRDEQSVPVEIVITDLFPNVEAMRALEAESAGLLRARYESTNATDVPAELTGVRTLFTALHHFRPAQVREVLADAVRKRAPIAVFEPLERSLRMFTLVGAMSFIRGLTHAHIVRPLTVARALTTYVVPVAPAMFAWDGMISTLRTYTADELLEIARSVADSGYSWDAGRFDVPGPYGQMPTTYLEGIPA